MRDNWEIDCLSFDGESNSKTDWGSVINSGLGFVDKSVTQSKGRLNEDAKQGVASKKEAQALKKRIKTECRVRPLSKSKRATWEVCKNKVVEKFEASFSEDKTKREVAIKLALDQLTVENKIKKRNQTIIISILGISVIIVGYFIYKKRKG
jgi:hypothetical protein